MHQAKFSYYFLPPTRLSFLFKLSWKWKREQRRVLEKPKICNPKGLGFSLPLRHSSRSTCSSIVWSFCASAIANSNPITQFVLGYIERRNWHVKEAQCVTLKHINALVSTKISTLCSPISISKCKFHPLSNLFKNMHLMFLCISTMVVTNAHLFSSFYLLLKLILLDIPTS
jgi:hypothetical protein